MNGFSKWMISGMFPDNSVQMERLRVKFESSTRIWHNYVAMKEESLGDPETLGLCEETEREVLKHGEAPAGVIALLACNLPFGSNVYDRSDNIRDLIQVFTQTLSVIHEIYKINCKLHTFTPSIDVSSVSICTLHYHLLDALSGELVRRDNFDFYGNVLNRPLINVAELTELDQDLSRAINLLDLPDKAFPITRAVTTRFWVAILGRNYFSTGRVVSFVNG